MQRRQLPGTDIFVTPIALGCWPITGMTSLDVNRKDSLATIAACFDAGINFVDTAYMYGADGESERMIGEVLGTRRDEFVIATKCGLHWNDAMKRVPCGRPETLRQECETSLQRLQTDRVEILYLHGPDPATPLSDSAGALLALKEAGKARTIGASNLSLQQLKEFHAVCPLTVFQPHYNMLQREIETDTLPWCQENNIAVTVYWPLMKGLLAGKMPRDYKFVPEDGRTKYPMFQGEEWQKNQDFVDVLRGIAGDIGRSVAQVVINWTIHRPGITATLCGSKRAAQVLENAGAVGWDLTAEQRTTIDQAIADRGPIVTQAAV
jgi:aryl-alcohol dehydrogenase-like predicted oxidoreductase